MVPRQARTFGQAAVRSRRASPPDVVQGLHEAAPAMDANPFSWAFSASRRLMASAGT
jgi:hypothetical protein